MCDRMLACFHEQAYVCTGFPKSGHIYFMAMNFLVSWLVSETHDSSVFTTILGQRKDCSKDD